MPERPMNLKLTSSTVDLGLLEGVTTVVTNVGGTIALDVNVVGTSRDPHFDGRVDVANASFLVVDSGSRYKNGRLAAQLTTDRVTVEALHIEDVNGHPLDVQGSLGTHELRVGDLAIRGTARQFEVLAQPVRPGGGQRDARFERSVREPRAGRQDFGQRRRAERRPHSRSHDAAAVLDRGRPAARSRCDCRR